MNQNLTKKREKRLSKTLMPYRGYSNLTDIQVYSLWAKVSEIPGWAGIIGRLGLLSEKVLLKLEEFDDKMIAVVKKEEEHYSFRVSSEVKKELKEFVKEMKETDSEFVKSRRLEYLVSEIKKLEEDTKETFKLFKKNGFSFIGDVVLKVSKYYEKSKKLKRFQFGCHSIKFNKEFNQSLSDEYIEMARSYPIENLIDIKKNFALCINHDDHKPSMYCKNNFVYCFSCGFSADSIGVAMKIHNLGFKDAVQFLNNNI